MELLSAPRANDTNIKLLLLLFGLHSERANQTTESRFLYLYLYLFLFSHFHFHFYFRSFFLFCSSAFC